MLRDRSETAAASHGLKEEIDKLTEQQEEAQRTATYLGRVLASLNTVCPDCKAEIEPSQIMRVGFDEIKCPWCDAIFQPRKTTGVICPHCRSIIFSCRARRNGSPDSGLLVACEKCSGAFLIVDGVPMTEDQYSRKGKA